MQFDIWHIVFMGAGILLTLLKDYIQQRIFLSNLIKTEQITQEQEMEKMMQASGFGLNEDLAAKEDSGNIEPYYKGYYS